MTITANDPDAIVRRIRWNHKTFQTYNIGRLREMMRYLPRRRVSLFQAVPFLLHVNHPELTGYVAGASATFGIQRFYHSGFWRQGLRQFGLTQRMMRPCLAPVPAIHGLYLMGSLGTLAQTPHSDMDYWVITDGIGAGDPRLTSLREKLDAVAAWGLEAFGQLVTFFILDAGQVVRNAFAAVDADSSGSAQRTLLKEEFYRTFIFVAGRLPYWAVLPPGLDAADYDRWIAAARTSALATIDDADYIDLGAVTRIDPAECLGAILWQVYKARHDPVKALIKAALIGHYFFRQDALGLLCEQVKCGFGQAPSGQRFLDPYAVVFEHAEAFFHWIQDDDGVDLIRRAIYFRLIGFPNKQPFPAAGSPKAELLERTIHTWGWTAAVRADLDGYGRWSAGRWQDFEARITGKIGFVFELLQAHGHEGGSGLDMDPGDLIDLKGRISATFQRRPGKVPRCPAAIQARAPGSLMIAHDGCHEHPWQVRFIGDGPTVTAADDLLPLVGWLLRNRMISPAAPLLPIRIADKSHPVGRVSQVMAAAAAFFDAPVAAPSPYLQPPQMDRLLVVFFTRVVFSDDAGLTVSYLWRNSWGEFYSDTQAPEMMDSHWSRLHGVASRIHRLFGEGPCPPGTLRILDCRLAPEPRLADTVVDMLRTMDTLRAGDIGNTADDGPRPQSAPILDLF